MVRLIINNCVDLTGTISFLCWSLVQIVMASNSQFVFVCILRTVICFKNLSMESPKILLNSMIMELIGMILWSLWSWMALRWFIKAFSSILNHCQNHKMFFLMGWSSLFGMVKKSPLFYQRREKKLKSWDRETNGI